MKRRSPGWAGSFLGIAVAASGCRTVQCGGAGATHDHLAEIASLVFAYQHRHGKLPPGGNKQLVKALRADPVLRGKFEATAKIDWRGRILDVWEQPLVYECPTRDDLGFRIYSVGPDGIDDDRDDDDIWLPWGGRAP